MLLSDSRTVKDRPSPLLSVIVPARNEAASLPNCLSSLVEQGSRTSSDVHTLVTPEGVAYEMILVDDSSTDKTRAIAESYDCVQVVDAGPLPSNWTGKSNACAAGARLARGEWLLFTDSDTFHKPGSLARALNEVKHYRCDLLSYSPEQEVRGFYQRSLMPVIFAELATTYKPKEVSDSDSPTAAANGQFLLIKREAYESVGGHAAVASDLLEDVALARLLKRSGRKLRFRYGGDAVRTRMYRTLAQMREGWTKNLSLLFPDAQRLAAIRLAEFILSVGGFAAAVVSFLTAHLFLGLLFTVIAVPTWLNFLRRVLRAHFDLPSTALSMFGLPLFSYLLWRSRISHKKGRVAWKGRTYNPEPVRTGPNAQVSTTSHVRR